MTLKYRLLFGLICCLTAPALVRADEENRLARAMSSAQVPIDKLPDAFRDKVADLLKNAALYSRGPVEAFPCRPGAYEWLIDHPQWGFRAWRALGAQCAQVEKKDDGWFVGVDPQGSELRWHSVLEEPGRRLWYVEGAGRIAPLTPQVTLKALVSLRYQEVVGVNGRVGIRHRAELYAQFEEKAVTWLAKLTGMTADSTGNKVIEQIELFFSGMAWYVSEHPAWAKTILQPANVARPEERQALESFLHDLMAVPKS